jgi:hypothetical protein
MSIKLYSTAFVEEMVAELKGDKVVTRSFWRSRFNQLVYSSSG